MTLTNSLIADWDLEGESDSTQILVNFIMIIIIITLILLAYTFASL